MRGRPASLVARFTSADRDQLRSCSVVLAELLLGAEGARDAAGEVDRVNRFVGAYPSLPFDDAGAAVFASLGRRLDAAGERIDGIDLMIVSIAVQHGLTLVTHNARHFARVPGLRWEDWES